MLVNQLLKYKKEKRVSEEFLASGLWAYTRHSNRFGEVSFWWALNCLTSGY